MKWKADSCIEKKSPFQLKFPGVLQLSYHANEKKYLKNLPRNNPCHLDGWILYDRLFFY